MSSNRDVTRLIGALAAVAVLAACDSGPEEVIVARAADQELTVDETTRLLAGATQVPNDPRVVVSLADLWIDYSLLAVAMAEDSTLSHLDVGPLVQQRVEAQAITAMADSLVKADTAFSEGELEELFASEGAGVEARARHILFAFPPSPSQDQIDDVRRRAEQVRERIAAGEDFAELARRYSADQGSAAQGGDLGFFQRGQMVQSFDEAVFALEPGELSDVVQTPYGFHVIRLEEKRLPEFSEVRDEFRRQAVQRRIQSAESAYVADLMVSAELEVSEDGIELARQMARDPDTRLSARAARRPVAGYAGGELTVGEVRDVLLTRPPQFRAQVAAATDEMIREGLIEDLVRREVLVERAESGGFEPSEAEVDSLADFARGQFSSAARQLGLGPILSQPGETREETIERTVMSMFEEMLSGARQATPLGAIGFVLRREYPFEIFQETAVPLVVERVAEARGPAAGTEGAPGGGGQTPLPDTQAQPPAPGGGSGGGEPGAGAPPGGKGG